MSKALVVGYGSIGARHARILAELDHDVAVVSRRVVDVAKCYADIGVALQQYEPDYVVVANRTAEHHASLQQLHDGGFAGITLVEKPLFDTPRADEQFVGRVFVAYNLRFHPVLRRLRKLLEGERILSAQIYVGQYLPQWRPQTDYRTSYSASAAQGGGVLRDLSHELDYLMWLFGGWRRVAALGGHFSTLDIDSDDVYGVLLETPGCPVVSLQMNYLDRVGRRTLVINTDRQTIKLDLVGGTISVNDQHEIIVCGRDDTYREMHSALLDGRCDALCSYEQGRDVLDLIEAVERAATRKQWVER